MLTRSPAHPLTRSPAQLASLRTGWICGLIALAASISSSPAFTAPQNPVYYLHNLGLSDGEFLHIPPNATVYMDMEPSPDLGGVLVEGSLIFLTNLDAPELRAGWILVGTSNPSYTPQIKIGSGTSPTPSSCEAKITLLGGDFVAQDPEDAGDNNLNVLTQVEAGSDTEDAEARAMLLAALEDGGLVVYEYGKLLAFGADAGVSWAELAITAESSPDIITVGDDDLDLWVGKEIVVASTDFDSEQAEVFMVEAADPNSNSAWTDLSLDNSLVFDHYALTYAPTGHTTEEEWQVREYAEVGLLTRNVVIRTQSWILNEGTQEYEWIDGNGEHGHVMVCRNESEPSAAIPVARLSWVQFLNLGIEGELMRYPLHFHFAGEQDTVTYPSFVTDCSFTHCFNKFLAIHNTQDMTVSWNVGYDTIGNGFYLEDEETTGIVLQNNLGLGVKALELETFTVGPQDLEPAVFWYVSANNKISGNHAAGSDAYGFWYHPGPTLDSLEFTVNGTSSYFVQNVAHSNRQIGFYPEKVDDEDPPQRARPWYDTGTIYQLEDCTFYKNRRFGLWLRSFGRVHLNNIRVADNRSGFYLASDGFQSVTADGPDSSLRTLSHIRLYNSLAIGQTSNLGYEDSSRPQEYEAGRSMPQVVPFKDWIGRPHEIPWAALTGVELYDGLIELEGVRFAEFEDFDLLDYPAGASWSAGQAMRRGAAITQVAYDSQYMIDPRNLAYGLEFAGTVSHKVHFRYPIAAMTANMIKNTILHDLDDSASGVDVGYLVPLDEPFLYEGIDSGNLTELTGDEIMFIDDSAVAFGSLVITPLEATSPLTVWTKVKHEYNVPNADVAQFVHDAAGEHRYPLTVPLNNWYTLAFYDGSQPPTEITTPPGDIKLELRFAEQEGDWIIIAVPWGSTEPDTIEVDGDPSEEKSDFESLEDSTDNAFWWDDTNDYIIVKIFARLQTGYGAGDLLTTGTQNICRIDQ